MSDPRRIFLVGPMGAGKSTVGRKLAKRLSLRFVDSDRFIEERTGVDIPRIFDIEGETGFRERESAAIDCLTAEADTVLATGGGAILRAPNRRWLRERGWVVYLLTPVETQWARTRDSARPLVQTDDPRARLETLFEERDPLYREIAHAIVSTVDGSATEVAERVIGSFRDTAT